MHRKSERIAISKRKFIFKHYKTLKSLNKMIKVGINDSDVSDVSYSALLRKETIFKSLVLTTFAR